MGRFGVVALIEREAEAAEAAEAAKAAKAASRTFSSHIIYNDILDLEDYLHIVWEKAQNKMNRKKSLVDQY